MTVELKRLRLTGMTGVESKSRIFCGGTLLPLLATLLATLLMGSSVDGQTSYPMLMSLHPAAAQIGTTTEHTLQSRYDLFGASEIQVSGSGVVGEVVLPEVKPGAKAPVVTKLTVRFHVDADAIAGVREFRVLTPRGASTLGQLVIAPDPIVVETKENSPETPQSVATPATWCGVIEKAEDVDAYEFEAKSGESLSFQVRSMRLQNKIHDLQQHSDPIIILRNANGSTVATSDNFFYGDPFLSHRFESDGKYTLEIRDVRYQGNKYWCYCIETHGRPVVHAVHPLAIATTGASQLQLIGAQCPTTERVAFEPEPQFLVSRWTQGVQSAAALLDVAKQPVVAQVYPTTLPIHIEPDNANNDSHESASLAPKIPTVIAGRLDKANDIDCFRFTAEKGKRYSFNLIGRRLGSAIDSHLTVRNADGKTLTTGDDLRLGKRGSSDSWIENWAAPADGEYSIEVRDLHLRGGPSFVYALKIEPSSPCFELYLDTDKTLLTPGGSGIIYARVVRKNGFVGEVHLSVEGLPEGVSASCGRILDGKSVDGCVVLTAPPDAKPIMQPITVRGDAAWTEGEGADAVERRFETTAIPYQETYQPGGGRGHFWSDNHVVSIGEPSDIRLVKLSDYDVRLDPGGSVKVGVEIERAEGFDKNVSLDVIFKHLNSVYGNSLPAGVTMDQANSKVLLTKGAVSGHITLKAAADAAPVERQQTAVMANVSLNFVMKATYASEPLFVTVNPKAEAQQAE